jgi:outer membrane protein
MSPRNLARLCLAACLLGPPALAQAQLVPAPGAATPTPSSGTRTLTLEECIAIALQRNPDVSIAHDEVAAAEGATSAMRGNFLPKGRVEFNYARFAGPYNVSFALPAGLPAIPGLESGMNFQARDATVTGLTLSALQPIGALWSIYEGYKVSDLGVDVAKVRQKVTLRDTAYQATEAFYRTLQAMRLAEVARMSVEQLEAQVQRSQSFYQHGLIGNNDFLRAQLGLASARQRLIATRGNVTLAQGRLAYVLGLPTEIAIIPAGAATEAPVAENLTEDEAERRALSSRIELKELEARIGQAQHGVHAAWSKLLPDLTALFSYQHNTGSAFQEKDVRFWGFGLTWNFWEWGATYYGVPQAEARHRQALAARSKLRDGIRLETRSAFVTQASAREQLRVAQSALVQAEENFRLERKRYDARANTSFDVIDAESLLTQARAQLQTALYDYLIAQAALARAMGEEPVAEQTRTPSPAPPEGTHVAP